MHTLLALLLATTPPAPPVPLPVEEVTVFDQGARVTRVGTVSVDGERELALPPLLPSVDPQSVRVEVEGVTLQRLELRPVQQAESDSAEARTLRERQEAARRERGALALEAEVLGQHLALVDGVTPGGDAEEDAPKVEVGPEPLDPASWRASTAFLLGRVRQMQERVRAVQARLAALQAEEARLGGMLEALRAAPTRATVQPVARVRGAGTARVRLRYLVAAARWRPSYVVRLLPDAGRVQVTLAAGVVQDTGEDWAGARLALSSARPLTAQQLPRVAVWKLGEAERFIPVSRAVWTPPPAAPPSQATVCPAMPASISGTPGIGVFIGTVTDAANQQPVPDVVVTARSPSLKEEQMVVTDAGGNYRIPQLPAGVYGLTFEKEGFKPYARCEVGLRADRTARVNVQLLGASAGEAEYAFQGAAPTMGVGSTSSGINVGEDFIRRIAVNRPGGKAGASRSFEQLAELAPGAQNDAYGVSVNGATSPENGYRVDGLSTHDAAFGINAAPSAKDFAPPALLALAAPPAAPPPQAEAGSALALAGGRDLRFRPPRRETVRSGEGLRTVALRTETWPVEVERRLYPALSPEAYLTAELKIPLQDVLPGGTAELFVGEDPAGQAQLAPIAPGEPLLLPLGVDRAVRSERNVHVLSEDKGLLGKDEETRYRVELAVVNPYKTPIKVRLYDQFPVSADTRVKVELKETAPWAERDEATGALEWHLTVPPGGRATASFTYALRRARDLKLVQP